MSNFEVLTPIIQIFGVLVFVIKILNLMTLAFRYGTRPRFVPKGTPMCID